MRVLVVADIHSNLSAFEAVLRHAEAEGPLDAIWALGDLVGYGPEPAGCLERLRSYPYIAVAGNHDRAVAGQITTDEFNAFAARAAEWTSRTLAENERRFLAELPESVCEGDYTLVHGSLRDPVWEYLMSSEATAEHLARQTTRYSLVGHTHLQLVFIEGEDGIARGTLMAHGAVVPLTEARMVANPGGLGQPRDGDPRSAYALLDTDGGRLSFSRVEYDIARTQKQMKHAGLPDYLIDRLSRGR